METWTIRKLLDWTTDYFKKHNIEWPHLEAEILLAHTLGLKRIELYTQHEKVVLPNHLTTYKSYLQRRLKHEPIAYITGIQPFMSLDFFVNPSVLIPRPETEKLIEVTIDLLRLKTKDQRPKAIADIGTGCGCIAISLAKYLPNVKVTGIDSSPEAIKIAQENAKKHNVGDRCQFIVGNMLNPLSGDLKTSATLENKNVAAPFRSPYKSDLIVSNPPYIPTADIEKLDPDVKDHEPCFALDGGKDGLDYIRELIKEGPKLSDYLILEFGSGQAESIRTLAKDHYKEIKIIKDHAGQERIFLGRK